jgi:hypothetical protein
MGVMRRWVDVSRYQVERADPLDLTKARDAGYSIVNIALTGGRGYVSGPWAKSYADAAAVLGMGRSCYHWLDGRTPGRQQALQQLDRMTQVLGGLKGFAHCVDVEETGEHGITPPTWQHIVDYVGTVQETLDRPVVIYSGDWWWPKSWTGSHLTPYLMGMPTAGKLAQYPGDTSPHWTAGYGGWGDYAVLQWGTAPLPGTGNCSLSVIRDPAVWATITGGPMAWVNIPASTTLLGEFNAIAPSRDKSSDGTIGDGEHAQNVSDHNPDETGNVGSQSDPDSINEVHARDVDASGPWPAGWSMERIVQLVLARCRSGAEKRLRYIIFNRRIWSASNGWVQQSYTGVNPHDKHAHFSFRYGSGEAPANPEQIKTPYGILAAVRASQQPQEDDMSAADVIDGLKSAEGQAALRAALFGTEAGREQFRDALLKTNVRAVVLPDEPPLPLGSALHTMFVRTDKTTNDQLPKLRDAVNGAADNVNNLRAQLSTAADAIIETVRATGGGAGPVTPELLADALEIALRRVFGSGVS